MKRVLLALCLSLVLAVPAHAQETFSKNVKIIVPFGAGGGIDVTVRMMTDLAPKYLNGKQLVVENLPGGGAVIGLTAAAKAKPDGYTLVTFAPSTLTNPLTKKTSFTKETFRPVILYCFDPTIIVVNKESPIKDLKSFVEKAKAAPVSVSTAGHSNMQHLCGMQMEKQLGLKINYVHAAGGGAQLPQILGGHVDAALMSLGEVASYLQDGSLRCVGLASDKEYPGFPAMDRLSSVGFRVGSSGAEWGSSRGICALAGTPEPMLKALETAFLGMVNDPVYVERMNKGGYPLMVLNTAEFTKLYDELNEVLKETVGSLDKK